MPPGSKKRGSKYFQDGRVHDIQQDDACSFSGTVRGGEDYKVSLEFIPDEGWWGECTCPMDYQDCKHLFAFGKALLAEHNHSRVQDLSGFKLVANTNPRQQKNESSGSFIEEVRSSLGRELNKRELDLLMQVLTIYSRVQSRRDSVTYLDFRMLGMPLGEAPRLYYSPLKIWPELPKSPREFWNYMAFEAAKHGVEIPEFMRGVTDIADLEKKIAVAQRAQLVERWKRALGEAKLREVEAVPQVIRQVDLRLRFGEYAATLEWIVPGKTEFTALKPVQIEQLRKDLREGVISFPPDSEWIWEIITPLLNYGHGSVLQYANPSA